MSVPAGGSTPADNPPPDPAPVAERPGRRAPATPTAPSRCCPASRTTGRTWPARCPTRPAGGPCGCSRSTASATVPVAEGADRAAAGLGRAARAPARARSTSARPTASRTPRVRGRARADRQRPAGRHLGRAARGRRRAGRPGRRPAGAGHRHPRVARAQPVQPAVSGARDDHRARTAGCSATRRPASRCSRAPTRP